MKGARRSLPPRSRARGFALALVLGAILAITLVPSPVPAGPPGAIPTEGIALCLPCGELGTAHFLLNVALFLPLGVVLGLGLRGWLLPALLPVLLSLGIEIAQLAIPGRQTALADLVANSAGGWLGLLAVRSRTWWLFPSAATATGLGTAWSAAAVLGFVATGWLLEPAFPASSWYGQWTPRLGHLEAYEGIVLDARVGALPTPFRRLDDPEGVRSRLAEGAPVRVRFVAGPPPPGLAPIFSIFDERHREILLLGADGGDLVLRYRMRAADARLAHPDLRIRNGLRDVSPGDTLEMGAWRSPEGPFCLALTRGSSEARGLREARGIEAAGTGRCDLAHTAARGWALLRHPNPGGLEYRGLADALWAILLGLPAGWWLRRRIGSVAAATSLPVAALVVPLFFPLTAVSPAVAVGVAAGVGLGAGLRRLPGARTRPGDHSSSRPAEPPATRASANTRTQRSIRP